MCACVCVFVCSGNAGQSWRQRVWLHERILPLHHHQTSESFVHAWSKNYFQSVTVSITLSVSDGQILNQISNVRSHTNGFKSLLQIWNPISSPNLKFLGPNLKSQIPNSKNLHYFELLILVKKQPVTAESWLKLNREISLLSTAARSECIKELFGIVFRTKSQNLDDFGIHWYPALLCCDSSRSQVELRWISSRIPIKS